MEVSSTPLQSQIRADGRSRVSRYVLITPARNEAAFIELTLKSVVSQTLLPVKWVIVSDGSTDGTDDIIQKYVAVHEWIEHVRMPERRERHFAGKVYAFNAGYARVKDLEYDIIGNLDADISFDEDYLDFLMHKFDNNPNLGVGGTPFEEEGVTYDFRFSSTEHVSGACQLFRRECFESIGGYAPSKIGGVDLVAVLTARMKGWQTRTFIEKRCVHHRKMATAEHGRIKAALLGGQGDYILGVHPVWEVFRSVYQMSRKPRVVGGASRLAGFVWAMLTGAEVALPQDLVRFRRKEQMERLRKFFRWWLVRRSSSDGQIRTSA